MTDRPIRILIIDDSPEDRVAYRRQLTVHAQESFEFQEAGTGEEGLDLAGAWKPDCILLDYSLPNIDGLEVLTRLLPHLEQNLFAVVMLTGQGNENIAVQALKLGAQDYLVKSSVRDQLAAAVRSAMEKIALRGLIEQQRLQLEKAALDLKESQERLQLAQDAGHIGTFDWDLTANEVLWTQSQESLYGLDPGGFGGTFENWKQSLHPLDSERAEKELLRAVFEKSALDTEFRVLRPDGSLRWIQAKGRVFTDSLGKARRFLGVNIDITDRKAAEEQLRDQREWLEVTLSSIGDAVIATDTEGRINFLNPAAERLTGWDHGQGIGEKLENVFQIINEDSRDRVANPVRRVLETGSVQGLANHTLLISRDGRERPIDDCAAPIRDHRNQLRGVVLIFHDVSERRELEKKLHDRAEKLLEADRRKDQFLAMLAHELRNPLAPIRNAVQVLELKGDEPAVLSQVRGMIGRQVQHLSRLIEDLLEVSRLSRGKFHLQKDRIDLTRLIRVHTLDQQLRIEQAGLHLELTVPQEPLWVLADPTRIAQALDNLLDNALKFSNPGGPVRVSLKAEGDWAVLSVEDTGIGIEPDLLQTIFEPFAQVESGLYRERGGLGLGLTLVRGIVELHHGTIRAESPGTGQGTRFIFSLPREKEPRQTPSREKPPIQIDKQGKILVIEDNPDSAQSLKLLLEYFGYQVRIASNGVEGLDLAREFLPDTVLCDIGLPGLDGYGVARALREDSRTTQARLIAITGYGSDEDQVMAEEAGFDSHFVKPADPEKLLRALQRT